MRLVFDIPLASEGVRLDVGDLAMRPDDLDRFLLRLVRRAVPATPPGVLGSLSTFVTALGWPGTVLRSGNALAARYDLLSFVAGALIVAESDATLETAGDAIRATLSSARPDFSGSYACLADLWA